MPELPEVETIVRGLKRLEGKTLTEFQVHDPKVWFETEFHEGDLLGARLQEVTRRGKYLMFRVQNSGGKSRSLVQHLGTGARKGATA